MRYQAYLIVICEPETNAIERATIWSSPEWEQSRCLPQRTYVAYATSGSNFEDGRRGIHLGMAHPKSRYHWLRQYLDEPIPEEALEATRQFEAAATHARILDAPDDRRA